MATKQQWKSESRIIVRSLVAALLIVGVVYGERRLASIVEPWAWWLSPLALVVVLSIVLWWAIRRGQPQPVALEPRPEARPSSAQLSPTPLSSSTLHHLQSTLHDVQQTLKSTAQGRRRRTAWRTWPCYMVLGASGSGKTGLLEGCTRLVPPLVRPPVSLSGPTSDCAWWVFPEAIILDTCGRYASAIPQTQEHDEWCGVLELLRRSRGRPALNGILLTVAADALGVQPPEVLRRHAVAMRQRLHEIRRSLEADIPLYILVTRCDLVEGFVEFFAHLPEYARTQVFGWMQDTRPPRGRHPYSPLAPSVAELSAQLTRRLEQLRLFLLNEVPRTGLSRQQLFCFPEEFRALQRCLDVFLETLCTFNVPLDPPLLRGLFFCSAQQRGIPFSTLRYALGFKTPMRPVEEHTAPYFLHDLLTVILPRDRRLARRAARVLSRREGPYDPAPTRLRQGGTLSCAPSADAVAGEGGTLSCAPSADAVAGEGGRGMKGPKAPAPTQWRQGPGTGGLLLARHFK